MKKPFLIAEIGINHNGSVNTAKKLIDLAKKYNFDAVKFQKRNPDISTPQNQKDKKDGEILEVFEKGYYYKEKVVRHAKVIVNKK